jgi:hypothetical protein
MSRKNFAIGNVVSLNGKMYLITSVKKAPKNHVRILPLADLGDAEAQCKEWREADDTPYYTTHPGVLAHTDGLYLV